MNFINANSGRGAGRTGRDRRPLCRSHTSPAYSPALSINAALSMLMLIMRNGKTDLLRRILERAAMGSWRVVSERG